MAEVILAQVSWSTLARVSLPTGVWSAFDEIQLARRGLVHFWQVEVKSGVGQVDIGQAEVK